MIFDECSPLWSPKGNKIVFVSDRNGDYDIYIMNIDSSDQTKLTNNSCADKSPDWFPF